jgi:hypothetical protein
MLHAPDYPHGLPIRLIALSPFLMNKGKSPRTSEFFALTSRLFKFLASSPPGDLSPKVAILRNGALI